ncbi:hypothetical protein ACEWY4_008129 [Coilia grayii]|uniref:Protein Atg16l2 n=1 Tax=Coilia grayii TaxID=363190 RepID=A0ABD1K9Z3_9TELE
MAALECHRDSPSTMLGRIHFAAEPMETWKRHIIRQLKHRDKSQKKNFQDVIRSYISLLERTKQKALILSSVARLPPVTYSEDSLAVQASHHNNLVNDLQKTTGELAYQVLQLQQKIEIKDAILEEQHASMREVQARLVQVESERGELRASVTQIRERNRAQKREYDARLEQRSEKEQAYRQARERGQEILEDMIKSKQQAAMKMNNRNERRVRAREANLHKDLELAAKRAVNIDDGPSSVPQLTVNTSANIDVAERCHARVFRSASATSPRILSSIRELFDRRKRRGNSVCRLEEDMYSPVGICLAARVPAVAKHALDAHELGINAVRFSACTNLLATGGTDRVIKLWDITAGMLHHRLTLDGSNEGITSIEFDPTGTRILAASYDKSALFWRLDDCVPKFTLTGHSRKVTAAKFRCSQRQVVTGSADRTVKLWDLQRAACTQTIEVLSYCSDVVCSEYFIISGHYDHKIRFWDSRAASCTQELPLQGKVTSLDMCPDHRQLLSCSRDESLQVVDLRMSNARISYRAEGFKCGCDSTKAIFSPDGSYLAAGSADGAVYIWNVHTGNLEKRLPDMHSASINAVAWSLSGEFVVSVDKSRRAVLWSDI